VCAKQTLMTPSRCSRGMSRLTCRVWGVEVEKLYRMQLANVWLYRRFQGLKCSLPSVGIAVQFNPIFSCYDGKDSAPNRVKSAVKRSNERLQGGNFCKKYNSVAICLSRKLGCISETIFFTQRVKPQHFIIW
jgi:hypothetical protein